MKKRISEKFSRRALAAFVKWSGPYDPVLDDAGWWKWLRGFDAGFRAGLREAKQRAAK